MTVVLQLLVVVASAIGFGAYVLRRDRRDNPRPEEQQQSMYFPNHHPEGDEHEHRGAAMSRL